MKPDQTATTKGNGTQRDTGATRFSDRGAEVSRINGLSDGLFAIVLTLLVLELKLPELGVGSDAALYTALLELWPKLLSYVLTFLVVGLYWVAHHWDFAHIVRYDRRLLWLNLMFLFCVSLLPFTTALLGDHTGALSWRLYALNFSLIGVTLTAVWGYAVSQDFIGAEVSPKLARYTLLRGSVAPSVFLLSMLATSLSLTVAYMLPVLIIPLQRLLHYAFFGTSADHGGNNRPQQARLWRLLGWLPILLFALWSVWSFTFGAR